MDSELSAAERQYRLALMRAGKGREDDKPRCPSCFSDKLSESNRDETKYAHIEFLTGFNEGMFRVRLMRCSDCCFVFGRSGDEPLDTSHDPGASMAVLGGYDLTENGYHGGRATITGGSANHIADPYAPPLITIQMLLERIQVIETHLNLPPQ